MYINVPVMCFFIYIYSPFLAFPDRIQNLYVNNSLQKYLSTESTERESGVGIGIKGQIVHTCITYL